MYKSGKYIDRENGVVIPYRIRKSVDINSPLVVFFHGSGANGNDNFKQTFDAYPVTRRLKDKNAVVLLPQAYKGAYDREILVTSDYIASVKNLILDVCKNEKCDLRRIYLVGTSFGGFCVWELLLNFPDIFAAAVPVVGAVRDYKKRDFAKIKNIPLWVAHSQNDKNVPIESDDYSVKKLTDMGAPVKYSRWDKYGHFMSKIFYTKENWIEWLFGKSLDCNIEK